MSLIELRDSTKITEYWDTTCPSVPPEYRKIATNLTKAVVENLSGSYLDPERKKDERQGTFYTAIRYLDGKRLKVVAAIDARENETKLDFRLPKETATTCDANGEVSVKNERRGGTWVQSAVGTNIDYPRAKELLLDAIKNEFASVHPES